MNAAEIKKQLKLKGVSLAIVARTAKCKAPSVSLVVSGKSTSRAIADIIANVIEIPLSEIWPDIESYKYPVVDKNKIQNELLSKYNIESQLC